MHVTIHISSSVPIPKSFIYFNNNYIIIIDIEILRGDLLSQTSVRLIFKKITVE